MTTDRAGFALLLSVLLVLALTVMALGVLTVGVREAAIAGAAARRALAERRAEAAAVRAVEIWSTRALAGLAVGEARQLPAPAGNAAVTVERVDSGLFLVRSQSRVPGPDGPTLGQAGLLVRVLHPSRLGAAFPGALTTSGSTTVTDGTVDGLDSCAVPGPAVVAASASVGPAASVTGEPPIELGTPPALPGPDPFTPALAAELATVRHVGLTAAPRPFAVADECVADGRNWGSPDPAHPCHALRPVITASDLTVAGGSGHGVLVVDGDLTVTAGARLHGIVVVHGRLAVDGGSVVRGAVRADSAIVHGAVIRDGCALAAVLSAPALDRAFRPPLRWWVPVF